MNPTLIMTTIPTEAFEGRSSSGLQTNLASADAQMADGDYPVIISLHRFKNKITVKRHFMQSLCTVAACKMLN